MENVFLGGKKDTDVYILSKLDDESLVRTFLVNKYASELCRNNKLWLLKIEGLLGIDLIEYLKQDYRKDEINYLREFYLILIKLTDKLNEIHDLIIYYDHYDLTNESRIELEGYIPKKIKNFFSYGKHYNIPNYVWYYLYISKFKYNYSYSQQINNNFKLLLWNELLID